LSVEDGGEIKPTHAAGKVERRKTCVREQHKKENMVERAKYIENQEDSLVTTILEKEWLNIVESDFSQLVEHYPIEPNNTIWIDRLTREYGLSQVSHIKRAAHLLMLVLWRRRHQLIVQTLDMLRADELRSIVSARSLVAYFRKELTPKEYHEALQWAEWKLSMLPKKQNQFINGLAAELFQHTKVLQDARDSV